jgi:hypothetical protein
MKNRAYLGFKSLYKRRKRKLNGDIDAGKKEDQSAKVIYMFQKKLPTVHLAKVISMYT